MRRIGIIALAIAACATVFFACTGLVESGQYGYTGNKAEPVHLPDWLWATIVAGAIQGLVWFGAVNTKLTWIATRLDVLEKRFNRHIEGVAHRRTDED